MNKTFKAPRFLNLTIAAAFATLTPFVIPPHAAKAWGKGTCKVQITIWNEFEEPTETIKVLDLRVEDKTKKDWDTEALDNRKLRPGRKTTYTEYLTVDEGNDFVIVPRYVKLVDKKSGKGDKWSQRITGNEYARKKCFDGKKVNIRIK